MQSGGRLPVLAAMALATVMVVFATTMFPPVSAISDARKYANTAWGLATTGTFSYVGDVPDARFPPLHPIFLSLFFHTDDPDATVQTVLADRYWLIVAAQGALIVAAIGAVTESARLMGGRRLAWLTGLASGVYLPLGWAASTVLSEPLGAFAIALELLTATRVVLGAREPRVRDHVLFGLATGVLGLVKPVLMPWAAVPYVVLVATRTFGIGRAVRLAATALVCFAAVMSPWWIRNVVSLGEWVTTTNGFTVTLLDGTPGRMELTPAEQATFDRAQAAGRDGYAVLARERLSWWLSNDPGGLVRYKLEGLTSSVRYQFVGALMPYNWNKEHGSLRPTEIVLTADETVPPAAYEWAGPLSSNYHKLLWVLAALSVFTVRRKRALWIPLSLVSTAMVLYAAIIVLPRYWVALMPVVALLAAHTVLAAWEVAAPRVGTLIGRQSRRAVGGATR